MGAYGIVFVYELGISVQVAQLYGSRNPAPVDVKQEGTIPLQS